MSAPESLMLVGLLREGMVAGRMPFLAVTSDSMAPLLRTGDEIGVQIATLHQLRAGDLVTVYGDEQMLTHRFYGAHDANGSAHFLTRGDRSSAFDYPWSEDCLLGRVVVRRRNGQLFWLDYGRGRWLNGRLALLAHYEQKLLGVVPFAGPRPLGRRLVRLSFRTVAEALTLVVEHSP